jgi:hypothetical protein
LRGDDIVTVLKRVPFTWKGYTITDGAEAVHNEFPAWNQAAMIFEFIKRGIQMDRNIVPSRNYRDFLRKEVFLAEMNTWAVSMIGPYNFGCKWHVGRARPEEVAWYIAQHKEKEMIAQGVPRECPGTS